MARVDNSPIYAAFSNPSGKACALGTGALYATTGDLYTCQSNVFVKLSSGSTGTVTHTLGALTAGYIVLGNNSADIKVSGVSIDSSNNVGNAGSYSTIGSPAVTPGTGQGTFQTEGTAPSAGFPAAGVDGCYADSTAHKMLCSFNNDTAIPLTRTVAAATTALSTGAVAGNTRAATTNVTATGVPTGLTLSSGGLLSGTLTTAAASALNVTATNAAGTQSGAPTAFSLTINPVGVVGSRTGLFTGLIF
jgi:serine protease